MAPTERSVPILGLKVGIEILTRTKAQGEREPYHYPVDIEREIAQLVIVRAVYNGQTEGGFYPMPEQPTTIEDAAQRVLPPYEPVLYSFPYRGD